jgi:hypothetical protein
LAEPELLARQLQNLSEQNDHVHIMPEAMAGKTPARNLVYRGDDRIFEWGKILFHPDDWDAEHFPHVMVRD